MEKTEATRDHLAQTVVLLGALVSLAISIWTALGDLSPTVQKIMVASTAVIAACCVYVVLGRRCVRAAENAVRALKHRRLVPGCYDRLAGFAKRLQQFCDRCYSNTVPSVLRDFPPLWKGNYADSPALAHLGGVVDVLSLMMAELPHTKVNLLLLTKLFDQILYVFDQQCVCDPVRQLRTRLKQGIPDEMTQQYDHLKQKYGKARIDYIMFREQYAQFARDLSSSFGESPAREYYESPDEL